MLPSPSHASFMRCLPPIPSGMLQVKSGAALLVRRGLLASPLEDVGFVELKK